MTAPDPTANYPAIAAGVYQACTTYDQYLPALSEPVARAWAKVFERYALTAEDLVAAVDKLYAERGNGFRPLPGDIAAAARAIRSERAEREPDEHRDARQAALDTRHRLEPAAPSAPRDGLSDAASAARLEAIRALAAEKAAERAEAEAPAVVGVNPADASCDHCRAAIGAPCVIPGSTQRLTQRRYHPSREEKAKAAHAQKAAAR